ncbi:MAG: hypothetical protein IJX46_10210 [Clostridia bacterium]|nr:hypothetical protein [Clostridia bacterium]
MDQKKKKVAWQQYVGMLFMVLIGVACGVFMAVLVDRFGDGRPLHEELLSLVALLAAMYIAIFFHLILHEMGHLVFGKLSGYTFGSFRIFSFMWIKENGKLRLKRHSLAGTGGQCLMVPPQIRNGKFPLALYNLGGSILNAVAGAIFLAAYFLSYSLALLSSVFALFAIAGFAVAVMNGVPMRMGNVDNDGYNAFALSKNPQAVKAFWVQLKVVEQTSNGVRLKDMPKEWFEFPPDAAMKNSMVAAEGVFACNRLMDEGKFKAAAARMDHMLKIDSGMVDLHRNLLICDRIYTELIGDNKRDVIEAMLTLELQRFMRAMKKFPSVLRTQYAIASLFENDLAKAKDIRAQFEKYASSYPYIQDIVSERELMDIVDRAVNGAENKM